MSKVLKIHLAGLLLLAIAGCGPVARPTASEPPKDLSPRMQDQDITPLATPTDLPPTPTETLLPTPELPTPLSLTPVLETWSEPPTDAQSKAGTYFSVNYDASLWALTEDETGSPALLNRQIPYCKITPTGGGRGLPRGWTVDDQFRDIGVIRFEVVTASQNNVVQFINYFGSDGTIWTSFQVSFQEYGGDCTRMAEIVLSTLSSVVAPTPTPTLKFTLTPTGTPTP